MDSNLQLAQMIPPAEMKRVLDSDASAEIEPSYLTCLDYQPLSVLIPQHWTVIDFGCSYNAQSYWFQHHKRLICVDLPRDAYKAEGFNLEIFQPPWCELYEMSIADWLDTHLLNLDLDMAETFAICSYVPNPAQVQRVRETFKNVFVIYPSNKALHQRLSGKMKL